MSCESKKCSCFCHKILGVFVVIVGSMVALTVLGKVNTQLSLLVLAGIIVLTGLKMLFTGVCKCCGKKETETK